MRRARNAKGRFVSGKSRAGATSRRRNPVAAVGNRRRKRTYRRNPCVSNKPARRRSGRVVVINPQKRHYRHNPGFSMTGLGFDRGTMNTLLYTGGGLLGTPYLEAFLNKSVVPLTVSATTVGRYAVKVGSALGLYFVAQKTLGREAAKQVFVGGMLYVLVGALQEFMPTMFGATAGAAGMGRYIGTRAQPLLGSYQRNYLGNITAQTPGRLQPQSAY